MLEEKMLWLAIEKHARDIGGASPDQRKADVEQTRKRLPELEIDEDSAGKMRIRVRRGHSFNEEEHCGSRSEAVRPMEIKPAKPPKDPKPEF